MEYGYLKRLIDEKKKEFGINMSISSRTIKNRIQRGSLTTHHGAKSPSEEVEVALVEICIQMGKIRQPLSCTEAIALMNDMIKLSSLSTPQLLISLASSSTLRRLPCPDNNGERAVGGGVGGALLLPR